MNSTHLRTFLAVVEEHSITRGARRAHVSQSTASLHVRELEAEVGARLLERQPRGVALTDAGERMVGYAQRLLTLAEEARAQVCAAEEVEAETLRVVACHLAAFPLPAHFATLQEQLPCVRLSLGISTATIALEELRAGRRDLALVRGPVPDEGFGIHPIFEDELVLVASPDVPVGGSPPRVAMDAGARALAPPGIEPWLVADDPATVRRWALDGAAVGLSPRSTVQSDLEGGRLRVVRWPGAPVRCTVYAVWVPERQSTAARRAALLLESLLGQA